MYTADHARGNITPTYDELDLRIKEAVEESQRYGGTSAELRVSIDDPWCRDIEKELEKRGFHGIHVPDICIKGDVSFCW